MESWQEILNSYPWLRLIWDALSVIIPMASLVAYAGIFFISAIALILSITRKRASYNKCARQIAMAGLVTGWILLVAGRIWLYYTQPLHKPGTLENFMMEMSWMFLSLGVLLSSIYYTLWRVLKNMAILHVTLGMISAAQNCIALVAILFTLRLSTASDTMRDQNFPNIFPGTWNAPLWSAICYTIPLVLALGGGLGGIWLILRRKHEDFGRDYYNTMLRWCAGWTRNAWGALWLLILVHSGFLLWQICETGALNGQLALDETLRLLLWLIPLLLWTIVRKAKLPLRQRWAFILASFLSIGFMLPYYLEITLP